MLGADHPVGGEQAVLDIGEHGVGPAESGMARGGAIGAGDVALMDDARLPGNAAKPLAAIADDSRSGRDTGAETFGFTRLETAHDLEAGVQRAAIRGGLHGNDKDSMG